MNVLDLLKRLCEISENLRHHAIEVGVETEFARLKQRATEAAEPGVDRETVLYDLLEEERRITIAWSELDKILRLPVPAQENQVSIQTRIKLHRALVGLVGGLQQALQHYALHNDPEGRGCVAVLDDLRIDLIPAAYRSHVGRSVNEVAP